MQVAIYCRETQVNRTNGTVNAYRRQKIVTGAKNNRGANGFAIWQFVVTCTMWGYQPPPPPPPPPPPEKPPPPENPLDPELLGGENVVLVVDEKL